MNFLVQSGDLVRTVSKGTTRQWRGIDQYEKKHGFNFFIQWSDNFICDEVLIFLFLISSLLLLFSLFLIPILLITPSTLGSK